MPSVQCSACNQSTQTKARPGAQATCDRCGESFRVPLRKASGREIECPECGTTQRTGAAPGRRVSCKGCSVEIRVPMREAAPGTQVVCPECGAEKETRTPPGKRTTCSACQHEFRIPLPDPEASPEAPSTPPPPRMRFGGGMDRPTIPGSRDVSLWGSSIGVLMDRGMPGGAVLWVGATLWVALASAEDTIVLPMGALILYAMGLLAVISGALKYLSRQT